jgi:predicted MFS family arabinose efflux permease
MRKLFKPLVLLLIFGGIAICAVLFTIGASEDAPGMCAIGIAIAFAMVTLGVVKAGIIQRSLYAPILLFGYGAGGALLSALLLAEGEFENLPWIGVLVIVLGIALVAAGAWKLRKARQPEK